MTTHASFRAQWLPAAALGISAVLTLSLVGCKSAPTQPAPIVDGSAANAASGPDPAAANFASVGGSQAANSQPTSQPTRVMGTSQSYAPQQQSQAYPQQPPAPVQQNYAQAPPPPNSDQEYDDQAVEDGEAALEAEQAPPPLPDYDQPPAPDENDLWTPGYWDYGQDGYYWVPGAWVAAPYYGALWTPPYWGFYGGRYRFHRGYWGQHIGYYGGINYGYGYGGVGYEGGYWRGNNFYYNRAVNRIDNSRIHNVYDHQVVNVNGGRGGHVSYNGPGGVQARPQAAELAAMHEHHTRPMQTQIGLRNNAARDHNQAFSNNHGRPAQAVAPHAVAATPGIAAPSDRGGRPGFNNSGPQQQRSPEQMGQPNRTAPQQGLQNQQQQLQNQQRMQQEQGRQQIQQQRGLQQNQQQQLQNQQRVQQEQGRQQQTQQQEQLRNQQQQQLRNQQQQLHNQQQMQQMRNQNMQQEQQRQLQMRNQGAQQQQQRQQQMQQQQVRQQQMQQQQQMRQQQVRPQVQQPRMEAPRPAPQHIEAPRPAPHMEAPHPAPAAHPMGTAPHPGGGEQRH